MTILCSADSWLPSSINSWCSVTLYSSIWQMQNFWSVVDLFCQNSHWWYPVISSAYGVNLVTSIGGGRGANLTTHLHIVLRLRICGAMPSFLGCTAQLRPWPPPQNPAEFLGGFSTIFFFYRVGLLVPRPTPMPEDQASVFISPRGRVATHFSRLLRHAWVTVGLFLFPGYHTGRSFASSPQWVFTAWCLVKPEIRLHGMVLS
jgi:hypothetical protein